MACKGEETYNLMAPKVLSELTIAEANLKKDRATQRRIRAARFPQIKTLEHFLTKVLKNMEAWA